MSPVAARVRNLDAVNLAVYFHIFATILGLGVVAPSLPDIRDEFGVSYAQVSLVFSVFALARLFVDLPAGYLTTRIPGVALLCGSAALVGVGTFACGLAPNFLALLGMRAVVGAGSAIASTVGMTVLAQRADPRKMGQAMGMYHTALILGTLISPGLGGFIADAAGWRVAFYVCAFAALTSVGVTLTVLRRVPESRSVPKPSAVADGRRLTYRGAAVLIWPALIATFGIFFIRNAVGSTVFPLYGRDEVGLAAGQLGAILTLNAIISATLTTPAGMAADRWGSRTLLYPGFAFAAAGGLLLTTVHSLAGFALASAVFSFASLNNAVPSSMVAGSADAGSRGMLLGIYRFVGDLGFTVGPITMGFVLNAAGFAAGAWLAAGVAASGVGVLAVQVWASGRRHSTRAPTALREEQPSGS